MATVLRPLSLSELLDRTFFLYRKHFVLFVGIVALPEMIVLAIQLIGGAVKLQGSFFGGTMIGVVAGLVNILTLGSAHAATVIAVSDVHLERPISIGGAYAAIKSRLLSIVGIILLIDLGIGFGFILLIAPGIYLALTWALSVPVTVLEGTGLNATVNRSSALTKNDKGRIFLVAFLLVILIWIVSVFIGMPLGIVAALSHRNDPTGLQAWITMFGAVAEYISTCLVGPLLTIGLTLLYFDNRVRKEGFDLQLMMATMQQPATQGAPAITS
jgi:hypothetical protein